MSELSRTASQKSGSRQSISVTFWILVGFLVAVFLTGGASSIEVQSLIILYPLSVVACAIALLTLKREHFRGRGWLFGLFGLTMLVAGLHLVPLPPSIWQALPGRAQFAQIDHLVGLGDIWRPLTLTPMNGWHALVSLFTPLAVLLLGVQLDREALYRLLPVMLMLGGLSGLLGMLQTMSGAESALYLYQLTNNGSAVGFFANRNHAAVLLASMFPMLALFASTAQGTTDQQRFRQLASIAVAIVLIPLILVTGSRAGLITSVVGLVGAALIYSRPQGGRVVRSSDKRTLLGTAAPIIGGAIVLALTFLTLYFSRAEALDRLFNRAPGEDDRNGIWQTSIELMSKYFPFGSGSGSFAEAYQVDEPARLLDPLITNRAHNDWLEIPMTLGLPGMLLLATGAVLVVAASLKAWRKIDADRRATKFARAASIIILMLGIASVSDYPLRIPIMMAFAAILALWLSNPSTKEVVDG